VAECPDDYKKSPDGSACELRQYPLDRSFIPFPFVGAFVVLFFIILVSYKLTGGKTLVTQSTIASISIILFVAMGF
jgi:hypothetical protein